MESQTKLLEQIDNTWNVYKKCVPGIARAYDELPMEVYRDGALPGKIKRLMALTGALVHGCRACILFQTENTLAAGISPGLNIIFGNIGENKEILDKGVDFLLKYADSSQLRTIRPVTPYPGSPLYYYAIDNGLLKDCEDFYENKHVNSDLLSVNFTNMSDDEFYNCLLDANKRLLTGYYQTVLSLTIKKAEILYIEKNPSFRGFRQI